VEKDIVDVVKIRRLIYFGHVTRIKSKKHTHTSLWLHGHVTPAQKEKWMENICDYEYDDA